MGGGDLQPLLADRRSDIVQKAGPIAPVDLDHGMGVAGAIVDHDTWRDMNGAHAPAEQGLAGATNFGGEGDAAGQCLLD